MAEANSRFNLPPEFYDPNENPSQLSLPKEELTDSEVRQQISSAESINPINGGFSASQSYYSGGLSFQGFRPQTSFRAPPSFSSSSLPYSAYQKNYLQLETSPTNGGFPASQSWNYGGNRVDGSNSDNYRKYVNPNALPSIGNQEGIPRINSPVSLSWNKSTDDDHTTSENIKNQACNNVQLREFRNYFKLKGWTEEQIQSLKWCKDPILLNKFCGLDIHKMCMDQLGSQYLQNVTQIETAGIILDAVLKGIFQVMRDPSGNQVFKKLVSFCDREQLQKIVYAVTDRKSCKVLIDLVKTEHGTRCMQKLIDRLNSQKLLEVQMVLDALKPYYLELMMDKWARHLIQLCMRLLNPYQIKFIYETVKVHFLELAKDSEGYAVVLKATRSLLEKDPLRMELLTLVTDNAVRLAQDHRGSILIQMLLQNEDASFPVSVATKLRSQLTFLSKHRCGSRVVETLLHTTAMDLIVSQLLESGDLVDSACTEYGNFTVQNLIDSCKSRRAELYQAVAAVLTQHQEQLKTHPKGAWVWAKIIR